MLDVPRPPRLFLPTNALSPRYLRTPENRRFRHGLLNRYAYVQGDPVNATDPTGLQSDSGFSITWSGPTPFSTWGFISALPGGSCGVLTPILFAGCPGSTPSATFLW